MATRGGAWIAADQAALRRVATVVARAAPPEQVFASVTTEAGQLLGADHTSLIRYDPDRVGLVVAAWTGSREPGPAVPGTRIPLGGRNVTSLVFESSRPVRLDDYSDASGPAADLAVEWGIRTSVGVPVGVEGRLWGVLSAVSTSARLPADAEARLAVFTELVAAAIANAQARMELRAFAEEQAALRRVATLVAAAVPPKDVFAAVATEVGRLLSVDFTSMGRYELDGTVSGVGNWTAEGKDRGPGVRVPLGGQNVTTLVFQTGRPSRLDDYRAASGNPGDVARSWGARSVVGVPIRVNGRLWGVLLVASTRGNALPADTEGRLTEYTELVAAAIANAEARAQVTASRARIVTTADATRRRIERDLHDGAQQRLVSLALQLRALQAAPPGSEELTQRLQRAVTEVQGVLEELREIARGLHPAALADGGLGPALKALARRSAVPVRLDAHVSRRLREPVEVAAYYVVAEALTNAAKHANASVVDVTADIADGDLRLEVCDDGLGGADAVRGSGLVGLTDRVEALGGVLTVHSPPGSGTTLRVALPLAGPSDPAVPDVGSGLEDRDGPALSIGPEHAQRARDD